MRPRVDVHFRIVRHKHCVFKWPTYAVLTYRQEHTHREFIDAVAETERYGKSFTVLVVYYQRRHLIIVFAGGVSRCHGDLFHGLYSLSSTVT